MKLTSIGTVGRLGNPFVFNIPQSQMPSGGQRTIAGPYNRYRTIPNYQNGMLGSVQPGVANPGGRVVDAETDTFFGDYDWLMPSADEPSDYVTIREQTPTETKNWFESFVEDTGISDSVKELTSAAIKRGVNELKKVLSPQDVGRVVFNPKNGKTGRVSRDPNNPAGYIITYSDGSSEPYNNTEILVQGESKPSNNNLLLIAGIALVAIIALK